ncbi:hypothetical protein Godav_017829 [Gossypium davidsonii]|uniref:Uncharacterized protein n=1 Tax=Gossypium davidsonii TaxID=34287 RepID=A0A7J8QUI3_GOSDV|nr:hypothetical protein [Gossypium davidsonii]
MLVIDCIPINELLIIWGVWPLRNKVNEVVIHCIPPPHGWTKFNVASVTKEEKAGCGGRNSGPWSLWNLLIGIDHCINQLVRVHFAFVDKQCKGMGIALAIAGVKRPTLFKSWW